MTHSLKNKVVWITGGKRIGQEIAKALSELGVDLVVSYRSSREEAEKFSNAFVLQCDVTDRKSVEEAVNKIKEKFGKLDILVLLASIFKPVKFEDISEKDWDANFAAHVKGTFWPIQLASRIMPAGSHAVTVADRTALGKIGPKGVFINSIAPGPVLKPNDISEEEWRAIRKESIIKYPLTDDEAVQEFVDTVLRLCSVRSSGSVYPLDFGHL